MSKKLVIFIVLLLMLTTAVVYAVDSQPASKATAQYADFTILEWQDADTGWETVLATSIKTSQQKDLFIDASFETGLWTYTKVRSKDMTTDTSTATASVKVRVLVDGNEAFPGEVIFGKRTQELSATLQGQLDLVDSDGDGIVDFDELQVIAEEEISLLLNTLSANSFNFIAADLGSGTHTIEVQAKIDGLQEASQLGEAVARAMIGKGSVTIEQVRMIKDNVLTEITE